MISLVLLALSSLFIGSAAELQKKELPRPAVVDPEYLDRFQFACAYAEFLYGVKCGDLPAPYVVVSMSVPDDYYGYYYEGDHFVFINSSISREMQLKVVMHETMHYVLYWTGAPDDRCTSEEQARRAEALYSHTKYDDSWRNAYKCLSTPARSKASR